MYRTPVYSRGMRDALLPSRESPSQIHPLENIRSDGLRTTAMLLSLLLYYFFPLSVVPLRSHLLAKDSLDHESLLDDVQLCCPTPPHVSLDLHVTW